MTWCRSAVNLRQEARLRVGLRGPATSPDAMVPSHLRVFTPMCAPFALLVGNDARRYLLKGVRSVSDTSRPGSSATGRIRLPEPYVKIAMIEPMRHERMMAFHRSVERVAEQLRPLLTSGDNGTKYSAATSRNLPPGEKPEPVRVVRRHEEVERPGEFRLLAA